MLLYASAASSLTVVAPEISGLSGNWIGQSNAGEFARLTLKPDGSGLLAINHYKDQPTWLYRVWVSKPSSQSYGWDLAIQSEPIAHKNTIAIEQASISIDRISFVLARGGTPGAFALTPELDAMTRYRDMIKNPVMRACSENGC